MEEETQNLWNKKISDFTVGDFVKMNVVVPIIVIGTPILVGYGYCYSKDAIIKIKEIRKNHRKNKLKIVS